MEAKAEIAQMDAPQRSYRVVWECEGIRARNAEEAAFKARDIINGAAAVQSFDVTDEETGDHSRVYIENGEAVDPECGAGNEGAGPSL